MGPKTTEPPSAMARASCPKKREKQCWARIAMASCVLSANHFAGIECHHDFPPGIVLVRRQAFVGCANINRARGGLRRGAHILIRRNRSTGRGLELRRLQKITIGREEN